MESSRRDHLDDMAEHRPILKNNQNTYCPRFTFIPKAGIVFPKTGICFYCVSIVLILCHFCRVRDEILLIIVLLEISWAQWLIEHV